MDRSAQSKRVSWLLRHGARASGLDMDPAGWAAIADVIRLLGLSREALDRVVAENDKRRLEVRGDAIRAVQGHSLAGTPVTAEALEASWTRRTGRTDPVFHGTHPGVVEAIRREGLRPMDRTHVHLADARTSRVGKRANVSVWVWVDPVALERAGIGLFESPNGVWLARRVPPEALLGIEPVGPAPDGPGRG